MMATPQKKGQDLAGSATDGGKATPSKFDGGKATPSKFDGGRNTPSKVDGGTDTLQDSLCEIYPYQESTL